MRSLPMDAIGYATVFGKVGYLGAISLGKGFSVVHTATGSYTITFDQRFRTVPNTVLTSGASGNAYITKLSSAVGQSDKQLIVQVYTTAGALTDSEFTFSSSGPV